MEPLGLYRSKTRQGPTPHAVRGCFVPKPKSCRTNGLANPLCGALSLGALSFRCFVPACSAHPDGRCLHLDKAPGTKHPMHIILIFGQNDEPDLMAHIASRSGVRLAREHPTCRERTFRIQVHLVKPTEKLSRPYPNPNPPLKTYYRWGTCASPTVLRTADHVFGASPHGLLFLRCASGRRP